MSVDLVSYLSSGGESPRLWVNFNDYTKKLLLGESENPWDTPASYMAFYGQAHGLVKADVVVLDVWDLFQHWMEDDEKATVHRFPGQYCYPLGAIGRGEYSGGPWVGPDFTSQPVGWGVLPRAGGV